MKTFNTTNIPMTDRIKKLKEELYRKMPEIEVDRAVLITESYQQTEQLPTVKRRALAFEHILNNIPITIRDNDLLSEVRQKHRGAVRCSLSFRMNGLKASLILSNFVRQIHSIFQRKTRLYLERFFLIGRTRQTAI